MVSYDNAEARATRGQRGTPHSGLPREFRGPEIRVIGAQPPEVNVPVADVRIDPEADGAAQVPGITAAPPRRAEPGA